MLATGLALVLMAGDCPPAPADVSQFLAQRELCEHFRGEEPYSEQRKAEIVAALNRYCKGTDAWLAALIKKYANCPAIEVKLERYDRAIETQPAP